MTKDQSQQSKIKLNRPGGGHGAPMMGDPKEKVKDIKGTARKLLRYVHPQKYTFLSVVLLAILSTVFAVFAPKILGLAIDELFHGVMAKMNHITDSAINFHAIMKILLILLGVYLISALASYIQEYMMARISQTIIQQMRNDVSQKLHHLPLKFFDTKTHGEILSRVTNDIDTISSTFQQSLIQIVTSVITLVGITAMMLLISPLLSLVAFLTLPLSFVVTFFIAKKSQKFYAGQQAYLGNLNGHVEEMYGGHNIIKAFNYEKKSIQIFDETNRSLFEHGWKAQFVSSIIFPLLNFVSNISFVGICVLGGYFAATGRMTLGSIQAFISYSKQFNQPIMQVSSIVNVFQATLAAAERVFEIMEQDEALPDPVNPQHIEHPQGEVKFNHISFRYKEDEPLIEDISFEVSPGKTIAIVGPTGAGKTTLVNLLMRFYELDKGSITIDGVNIAQMTRKELHLLFGMVLQDTWLFKGTIRDNIAYGKKGATEEDIIHAAKISLADSFIRTLPDGYDTIINEEANNISQGQKQLLTIARAVISDPKIMILDEATSSVDTRTEVLIKDAMASLMKGRTNFVIAHRLSTIRDADLILVMNKGQIVEKGTHKSLLAKGEFYANLYNSQFSELEE